MVAETNHRVWKSFEVLAALVLMVAVAGMLVVFSIQLNGYRDQIADLRANEAENLHEVFETRVVGCRTLLALRQEIQPGGPCANPEVAAEVAKAHIDPIGTVDDARMTQRLVCSLPGAEHVPSCLGVLGP